MAAVPFTYSIQEISDFANRDLCLLRLLGSSLLSGIFRLTGTGFLGGCSLLGLRFMFLFRHNEPPKSSKIE